MAHIHWHKRPTIGVLAGWQFYRTATNLSYLKPIFNGINQASQDLGCNVFFGCGMGASARPSDPVRSAWPVSAPDADYIPISSENTDGLIVCNPLHSRTRSQYIQNLRAAGHPILFIGSGESGPTLAVDNSKGIFEAVGHLVQHGHRKIAFLAGSPDDMLGDSGDRLRAYEAALEHYDLEINPKHIVYGQHVYNGGYEGSKMLLNSDAPFTAILASNDEMALGAMQLFKEQGLNIPQDIAVIGFDNRLESMSQEPGLTSVHVPLYELGYHAVELMKRHLDGTSELSSTTKINTRLVLRESCGCSGLKLQPSGDESNHEMQLLESKNKHTRLAQTITTTVLNQAQSLPESECRLLCDRVLNSFFSSIQQNDGSAFLQSLDDAIQRTVIGGDDAYIWQNAITLLKQYFDNSDLASPINSSIIYNFLDQARQAVSLQMQRQHRHMVVNQRWFSSRLSLLTASLQTVLDETRIYEILAQHLPDMDINMAMIVLFEAEKDNPIELSVLHNSIKPEQLPVRFPSQAFPPEGLFERDQPIQLTLIPLVDQAGQLGYVVFRTEYFDLYGAIVQQLGGAFNTARLYRQATEGRRLAEEANRMKSRFLSTISHELRTPLNLIVGLSGMVVQESEEGDVPLPEPVHKDVDRIHAYSQHLSALIGDVIDLATSDAGQLRLNNENVNLGQALRLAAESGNQLANDKGLTFEVSLPEIGPWVWGDPTRLRQVVLNLINNAIKFTTKGSVSLRLEEHGNAVTVSVRDTGLGIPPGEQDAIFDEFRQSDRSVALGYGGLGLGLAISKRLVEMHGGTISVRSAGIEGAGSTFSFTLPTIQVPPKNPSQPEKFQPAQLGEIVRASTNVVILTDRASSSERLCEELKFRGFNAQVLLISHEKDWRAQINEQNPDSIILDVSTDFSIGWKTLQDIKDKKNMIEIPVLLYSASQPDGSLLKFDYLTKPIEISELNKALDQQWLMSEAVRPTRNILIVDDEPNTLEMQARIVKAHSSTNHVLKAHNGKEALEILHQMVIDLVLLDLQMPEMDGFDVLEVMRGMESMRKIPVIVVTGKNLTEADMTRLNQGVATVLSKGLFSIDETIAHISAALENKRRLSGEAQRLIRIAMAYIHENFANVLSRKDIAQHIGITEDHLTFCFRQELGTTPIEYLQRYRVSQAKRLLKETQLTITEIALNVGFSDSGYFSRIFRRESGMTPEAFRRS